jgi:hypothetical protein
MTVLDELMEGIEQAPLHGFYDQYGLKGRLELEEYWKDEPDLFKRNEKALQMIEKEWIYVQRIKPRSDRVIELFDRIVLNRYSPKKDSKSFENNICLSCHFEFPVHLPIEIQLVWALWNVNQPGSLDLAEIYDLLGQVKEKDFERFTYRLRRNFVDALERCEDDYRFSQRALFEEDGDWFVASRLIYSKEDTMKRFIRIRVNYQVMVELARQRLPESFN